MNLVAFVSWASCIPREIRQAGLIIAQRERLHESSISLNPAVTSSSFTLRVEVVIGIMRGAELLVS